MKTNKKNVGKKKGDTTEPAESLWREELCIPMGEGTINRKKKKETKKKGGKGNASPARP